MKRTIAILAVLAISSAAYAQVAINEMEWNNAGTDDSEWVEIVGRAGTNLAGWDLVFRNGNGGGVSEYARYDLDGLVIPNDFTSAWGGQGGFLVIGRFSTSFSSWVSNTANGTYSKNYQTSPDLTPATWPASNAIQNAGFQPDETDIVQIVDPQGTVVDEWEYEGHSDGRPSNTLESQEFDAFDGSTDWSTVGRRGYNYDHPLFVFDDLGGDSLVDGDESTDTSDHQINSDLIINNSPAWTNRMGDSFGAGTVGEGTTDTEMYWTGTLGHDGKQFTGPTPGTFNLTSYNAGDQDPYTVNIAVPEPATMAVLGLGGVAALIRRRRA